jgi:hypothetical protein
MDPNSGEKCFMHFESTSKRIFANLKKYQKPDYPRVKDAATFLLRRLYTDPHRAAQKC